MVLRRLILTCVAGMLVIAAPVAAQQTAATITGRVVDAATMRPLPNVTVAIEGMQRGTVTRADGAFLLTGVPAGTHRLRATLLGYSAATQTVTVQPGATVSVELAMNVDAVALEGLVAVGYGTQRVEAVTGVVESLSAEDFNTGRIVTPEGLLAGKVAGLQVIDTGEPGGGISLRIRGGTSVNASNEPLFVVDGVPLPAGGGLSAGRNPLAFINPDDVANITVLKDASATAIYGSRGANGVILIETRRGLRDPQLSYSGSYSTSISTREPEMLTAEQFRAAVQAVAPTRMQYLGDADTDWRSAVLRSASGQEHAFGFAGVGDNMNYRLSLGYLSQEGVVRGTQADRFSGSLNYGHRLLNDRLNVRASLRGARVDDQFTPGGALGAATIFDPTQPIRTGSGYFEHTTFELAPNNPVAELELGYVEGTTYRSIASVEGQYRTPFLEGLTATTRVSYDVGASERRTFMPTSMWAQQKSPNPGYLNRSNPRETTGVLDAFLTYARPLGAQRSALDLTAGYSYERSEGHYPFFEAMGLESDLLGPYGVPTAEEVVARQGYRENRLASFFGRANYSHLDRYIATFSVRRDGSSRFGPGNQWGTFPAVGLAWRISEEPFMAGSNIFSDLRLRLSWGVNGNQAIGDYLWAADYVYGDANSQVQFGNEFVTTIRPSAVDPNIKWEETTSYNVGTDFGMFGDRLTGALEYYLKDTDDLIFRVPVAAGTNVSNFLTTNIGSVRNQGVELSLNGRVLNGQAGGFTWDAGFNAARNFNELLRINPFGGGGEQVPVGGIAGGVGSTIQVLQPGFAVNSFFVLQHRRNEQGKPVNAGSLLDMYVDQNGDGVINIDDRIAFNSPAPNWIFGHTSRLGYRMMDLSFTMRAHLGNHVYNNLASSQGFYNRLTEAAGPVNLHRSVMRYGFTSAQYFSDVYVEDASFLKMDNLTFGYRLPGVAGVQNMRLYGTVQNVFTLTGYSGVDPEAGLLGIDNNIYPRSRTFSVGASVGF